jgi:hypothetical protein
LDESAESTSDALQWLFLEHGTPLVLKSANGSGFIARTMRRFFDCWQIQPLFSPPRTAEYNGACEAGIGALKTRTHHRAAYEGCTGHWTADDAEVARRMANEFHYPWGPLGPTPQEAFGASPPLSSDARDAFRRTVEHERTLERLAQRYSMDADLGHATQAAIDRVAVGHALVEHGFRTFAEKPLTPPIPSHFPLKLS